MPAYRIYFRTAGQIHGREDFDAGDDVAAIHIARALYYTCSDACDSFDLWHGPRKLRARLPHHQKASLDDLIEANQTVTIDTLKRLRESAWPIAQSPRLVETVARAKSATDLPGRGSSSSSS
jgi:hypothetical protein